MIILDSLSASASPSKPCVLTIGNFDGVHLGHQRILGHMRALAGPKGTICVLTFSNHPSFVLPGKTPAPMILSKSLKLKYLEESGVDVVYCLDFTSEFAAMTYDFFLREVRKGCPFDYLVLGEGEGFGKKREGTRDKIEPLSREMGFKVVYLPKMSENGDPISSGIIRTSIQNGDLIKAASLLGRPFTIEGIVDSGQLILSTNFCLPPNGNYRVIASVESLKKETIAHIENGQIFLDFPSEGKKIYILFD